MKHKISSFGVRTLGLMVSFVLLPMAGYGVSVDPGTPAPTSISPDDPLFGDFAEEIARPSCKHGDRTARPDDAVPRFSVRKFHPLLAFGVMRTAEGKCANEGIAYFHHPALLREEDKQFSFTLTSTTVSGVLDALMALTTGYHWEFEGGVFNLLPDARMGEASRVLRLLETRVPEYRVDRAEVDIAIQELVRQAEVSGIQGVGMTSAAEPRLESPPPEGKQFVVFHGMDLPPYLHALRLAGGTIPAEDRTVTVHLRDKTIREILNAIVAGEPRGVWLAWPIRNAVRIDAHGAHGHTGQRLDREKYREEIKKARRVSELHDKKKRQRLTKREETELRRLGEELERFYRRIAP